MVWDADGKSYLDMLGGIAVNLLGHAHPAVVAAVTRQISTLGHVSNLFLAEPTIALAEALDVADLAGRRGSHSRDGRSAGLEGGRRFARRGQ